MVDLKDFEFHPLEYRVIRSLNFLKGYAEDLNSNIDKKGKSSFNSIFRTMELVDLEVDEQVKDFFNMYNGKFMNRLGSFNQIAWNSLFVSHYTLLEVEIRSLCTYLYENDDYNLKLNDLTNKGIFQAQLYLKKVVGINKIFDYQEWEQITYYNLIRNNIIHESSSLEDSKYEKKIKAFKSKRDNFKITHSHKDLVLTFEFINEVNNTIRNFFSELHKLTL